MTVPTYDYDREVQDWNRAVHDALRTEWKRQEIICDFDPYERLVAPYSPWQRLPEWEAAVNGSGKRPWFLQRKGADRGNWPGGAARWYLWNSREDLVRFGSYKAAWARAQYLNEKERSSGMTDDRKVL